MLVNRLNEIACHHLDHLEETYPIICAPTEQVIQIFHEIIVDKKPLKIDGILMPHIITVEC